MPNFTNERSERIKKMSGHEELRALALRFMDLTTPIKYSYNFTWADLPIIQYPQDIVAIQELIFSVKPDLVIETGVARGGSLMLSASALAMLDFDSSKGHLSWTNKNRRVVGVDVDIRPHNRSAIESSAFSGMITLLEGSSTDAKLLDSINDLANSAEKVMVFLDSNHTHDHVLSELEAYAPLVTVGSYIVVFDTIVEHLPPNSFPDRPWGPSNSPLSAVNAFLKDNKNFLVDKEFDNKLMISVCPGGFLRRVG
jgi:cephalosporin hydroxylase